MDAVRIGLESCTTYEGTGGAGIDGGLGGSGAEMDGGLGIGMEENLKEGIGRVGLEDLIMGIGVTGEVDGGLGIRDGIGGAGMDGGRGGRGAEIEGGRRADTGIVNEGGRINGLGDAMCITEGEGGNWIPESVIYQSMYKYIYGFFFNYIFYEPCLDFEVSTEWRRWY